jgi:hypothetical protein
LLNVRNETKFAEKKITFLRCIKFAVHSLKVVEGVAVVVNHLLEVAVLPVDLCPHFTGRSPHVAALFPGLNRENVGTLV